jgi:hypothetical protein
MEEAVHRAFKECHIAERERWRISVQRGIYFGMKDGTKTVVSSSLCGHNRQFAGRFPIIRAMG